MLDLVLSEARAESLEVSRALEALVPIDRSYHPPLQVNIVLPRGRPILPTFPIENSVHRHPHPTPEWNFRKADFFKLYTCISETDWSDIYKQRDIDLATDEFYIKLNDCLFQSVPIQNYSKPGKYVYPKWFSIDIIKNIQSKYFHLRKFKQFGKEFNRELFRYYRERVKELMDIAYRNYISQTQTNITRDPAKFWQYVKDKRKDRQSTHQFQWKDKVVSGQQAADAFAEFFGSVFHSQAPILDPDKAQVDIAGDLDANRVAIEQITLADLRRAIKGLKPKSSAGPDAIPTYVVRDCGAAIEQPLLYLCNLSLEQCRYPVRWKISKVTPIPKGGSSDIVEMFRPIAVPSVFGKIFESVIDVEIRRQVAVRLCDSQHGFRAARSTVTNHINFVDFVTARMDAGQQVDTTYFDFRKAFDMVDNDILLTKLASMGFAPRLLSFFASYLSGRSQYVAHRKHVSNAFFTRSGVSQGSTLGPTLFLLMVNDLPSVITSSNSLMFADDLKIFTTVNVVSDCLTHQRNIDLVAEWSVANRLYFNVSKCKTVTFSRRRFPIIYTYCLSGSPLERVNSIRDLGLTLDSRLDFNTHISSICKKACKTLGFVIRVTWDFTDIRVALMLYKAYVRSRLEFGAIVWDPHEAKYTLLIERVQRRFARYTYKRLYGYYPYMYPSMFVSGMVGLDTLQLRRSLLLVTHYFMMLRGKVDNPETLRQVGLAVPRRHMLGMQGAEGPRRPRALFAPLPGVRTVAGANAPTARALAALNKLILHTDADVFFDNVSKFYNLLAMHLSKTF